MIFDIILDKTEKPSREKNSLEGILVYQIYILYPLNYTKKALQRGQEKMVGHQGLEPRTDRL